MFAAIASLNCRGDAGEYNEVLSIGDVAPNWTDLPGTDGKKHSLADYKSREAVVIVFTCASCPTAVDYEDRINDLAKKYGGESGKAAVIAVCVNRVKGDTLPELTERAKQREFAFDYLYDESQDVARAYAAACTPDFYVFDAQLRCVYRGRLDDSTPGNGRPVSGADLRAALDSVLAGRAVSVAQLPSYGCSIKFR